MRGFIHQGGDKPHLNKDDSHLETQETRKLPTASSRSGLVRNQLPSTEDGDGLLQNIQLKKR